MKSRDLLLCLFGISVYVFIEIVGHEAIVGGQLASYHEFQYQVTILITDQPPICGGGIIKEEFVITAAHCVIIPDHHLLALLSHNISVLAGTVDLNVPGIVVKVRKVYVPLEYTPQENSIKADMAVLELREPLDLENHNLDLLHIAPDVRSFYANKIGKIAGLGWDMIYDNNEQIGDNSDDRLRFTHVLILNNSHCQRHHPRETISAKSLCARAVQRGHGTYRRGVCVGDDGGPLVYKTKTIIGILSKSAFGCSEQSSSGIYTRISSFRNFLNNTLNRRLTWAMRVLDV